MYTRFEYVIIYNDGASQSGQLMAISSEEVRAKAEATSTSFASSHKGVKEIRVYPV